MTIADDIIVSSTGSVAWHTSKRARGEVTYLHFAIR